MIKPALIRLKDGGPLSKVWVGSVHWVHHLEARQESKGSFGCVSRGLVTPLWFQQQEGISSYRCLYSLGTTYLPFLIHLDTEGL